MPRFPQLSHLRVCVHVCTHPCSYAHSVRDHTCTHTHVHTCTHPCSMARWCEPGRLSSRISGPPHLFLTTTRHTHSSRWIPGLGLQVVRRGADQPLTPVPCKLGRGWRLTRSPSFFIVNMRWRVPPAFLTVGLWLTLVYIQRDKHLPGSLIESYRVELTAACALDTKWGECPVCCSVPGNVSMSLTGRLRCDRAGPALSSAALATWL